MSLALLLLFAHLADWIAVWHTVILFVVLVPFYLVFGYAKRNMAANQDGPAGNTHVQRAGHVKWMDFLFLALFMVGAVTASTAFWLVLIRMTFLPLLLLALFIYAWRAGW